MKKSKPFRLRVSGENACFTRPEMKVERVSYDVITPSAARGIFEAILWKPAIQWNIRQIDVLKPVKWESVRRNEVGKKMGKPSAAHMTGGRHKPLELSVEKERQQRAGLFLKHVEYVLHADFEMTAKAGADDTVTKFEQMFLRRALQGQCFQQPYFGCREFPVDFELIGLKDELPEPIQETRDLGWMLYDLDYRGKEPMPQFFHAQLVNGSLDLRDVEVRS
ncbi:type I-C CRISPR-associated protein Cas5 [Verrucomicrobia bacterium S94]|nr:type I-C CRISPR-associated protein Cas5 [Verrucomicrobia bacterium S94]